MDGAQKRRSRAGARENTARLSQRRANVRAKRVGSGSVYASVRSRIGAGNSSVDVTSTNVPNAQLASSLLSFQP